MTGALAALYLIEFLIGYEAGSYQFALQRIGLEFSLDNEAMGVLVAVQFAAIMAAPLLFGRLADKRGKMPILVIFCLVLVTGCLWIFFSQQVILFCIGIFLVGMGYSICEAVGTAAMADIDSKNAARHIHLSQAIYCIGAVISPILSAWICDRSNMGWRALFGIIGILFVFAALFIVMSFRRLSLAVLSPTVSLPDGSSAEAGPSSPKAGGALSVGVFAFLLFIYIGNENGIVFFADSFFTQDIQAGNLAALSISVFWLAMIPSRILCAAFQRQAKHILLGSFLVGTPLLFGMGAVQNVPTGLAVSFLLGFVCAPIWPCAMTLGIQQYPNSSATVTSLLQVACALGGILFPWIFGRLSDEAGRRAGYFFMGSLMAIAFAVYLLWILYRRWIDKKSGSR